MNPSNVPVVLVPLLMILFLCSCGGQREKPDSAVLISDDATQTATFRKLMELTSNIIPEQSRNDSLAFLILPLQVSCPSCRTKAIDSILKHEGTLVDKHFILISANGGRKTIASYFRDRNKELPVIENKLFLDSTNQAFEYGLFKNKPTIYYTSQGRAYKKIESIPSTVKQDLHRFFSGSYY